MYENQGVAPSDAHVYSVYTLKLWCNIQKKSSVA